jgi:hypothetical protein
MDAIIYRKYDRSDHASLIDTGIIDYDGSTIIKTLFNLVLDFDGNIYKFRYGDGKFTIDKLLVNVVDYMSYNGNLYILDSEHKMFMYNSYHHNITYICDDGYFEKRVINTKSAAKISY